MSSKDTIKALSMRNQARTQVDVWFQSRDNYIHPTIEIGINGSDEINNNFDSGEVTFILHEDKKTMTIIDTGRGLPINGESLVEDEDGNMVVKPNYYLLLLKLFSGTNYDNNENGKITTGQHGLGLTISNYCSKYFNVKSYQNDKVYEIEFVDGGELSKELTEITLEEPKHGTEITFRLDEEIFTNTVYNIEEIYRVVEHMASVNTKIVFKVIHNGEEKVFHYENLEEYFDSVSRMNTCQKIIGSQKEYTYNNEKNYIELVMTTASETVQEAYLNITHLIEGGAINDGVLSGIRSSVNKYCKEKKLLGKNDKAISVTDIADSVSFVCNFLSTNAEYANQVKYSTRKELYKKITIEYVQELLEVFKTENPAEFEKMVKHILEVQKFNSKADNNKKKLKSKLTEKVDGLINFVDGVTESEEHGEHCELIVTEGDSASESAKDARDYRTQAVLGLRGKILNVIKEKNYERIANNDVIANVFKALGCGVENKRLIKYFGEYDSKKLRFGKLLIATDFDADGYSIQCLGLSMIYKICPSLIKEHRVYIVKTPLYEVKLHDGSEVYWFSELEKEKAIENGFKYKSMSRIKGLGELDADVMAKVGLNKETRHITLVTVEDINKMEDSFRVWMDDEVTDRKKIIETELNRYALED